MNTAEAIGPSVVRAAEFEGRAAQAYRTQVEKQMKADAVEVRDVSDRAKVALARVAAAKDDHERAKAFKAVSEDVDIRREVAAFRKSVEDRFGEEGARAILRAHAAGKQFEHPSVPKAEQKTLDEVAKTYSTLRHGERNHVQQVEAERLTMRESQGARLKP